MGDPAVHRCPNCGSPAPDAYCPSCGQRQFPQGMPGVREWLGEFFGDVFLVDGRLPRTIRRLAWPPGALTADWWAGRRASFMQPLRLYLLVVVPFFFVFLGNAQDELLTGVLGSVVIGSYLSEMGTPPDYLVSMTPLTEEERGDPVARAEWSQRFDSLKAARIDERERDFERVESGAMRIFEWIPIGIGLVMVPILAFWLQLLLGPWPFVGYLVWSLHLHAIGYAVMALGWIPWLPVLVPLAVLTAYLAAALRRCGEFTWPDAIARAWSPRPSTSSLSGSSTWAPSSG